jgi:hypothetical protein
MKRVKIKCALEQPVRARRAWPAPPVVQGPRAVRDALWKGIVAPDFSGLARGDGFADLVPMELTRVTGFGWLLRHGELYHK